MLTNDPKVRLKQLESWLDGEIGQEWQAMLEQQIKLNIDSFEHVNPSNVVEVTRLQNTVKVLRLSLDWIRSEIKKVGG